MTRRGWRFLAVWLAGRAAAWCALRAICGPVSFLIDPVATIDRLRLAQLWAQSPSICPGGIIGWLPLPFYLQGALLKMSPDPLVLPVVLNAALSLAIVVLVYRIGLELFDEPSALAASFMAAFSATAVMEGLEPSADCLFQAALLAGLLFWTRHARSGRTGSLWAAAFFLNLAALTRFEGWVVAAVFAAYALWRGRRPGPAFLVCAAPAFWLAYGLHSSSDPLAFLHAATSSQFAFFGGPPLHGLSWRYALLLGTFLHSDQSIVLILAACALPRASREPRARCYFAAFPAVALFFAVSNFGMAAWVGMHTWALQLWLMPLAGAGAAAVFGGDVKRLIPAAAVFALCAAATARNFVEGSLAIDRPGLVEGVLQLRRLEKTGALAAKDRVLVQLPVNRSGAGFDRLWCLAAPPGAVLLDRKPAAKWETGEGLRRVLDESGNPSVLDQPADALDPWLRENSVRLVVAWPSARLPASWINAGPIGDRELWVRSGDALARR